MKYLISTILTLILLSGCATSSLGLNKQKELVLNYSSQSMLIANQKEYIDFLNYQDLFVQRYRLEDKKGRVLFYEKAATDLNFEFNYGGLYSIMSIFDDSRSYDELYRLTNLRLVQIKLKSGEYLNVMIEENSTQIYRFVYGFSNEEFIEIANSIRFKEDDKFGVLKHEGLTFDTESKPLSKWSDELVFFLPLITPVREFRGR